MSTPQIPIWMKDPKIVAAWRLLETSVIVSILAFLGTLQTALASPEGMASYNWHTAGAALLLGIVSGLVNALFAYFAALKKAADDGPTSPPGQS